MQKCKKFAVIGGLKRPLTSSARAGGDGEVQRYPLERQMATSCGTATPLFLAMAMPTHLWHFLRHPVCQRCKAEPRQGDWLGGYETLRCLWEISRWTSPLEQAKGTKISGSSFPGCCWSGKTQNLSWKSTKRCCCSRAGSLAGSIVSHKGAEESAVISGASSEFVRSDTNDQNIYDTSDYICRCSIG